jgi:transcriptional regulator with XRE-family HTH domain
MINTREVKARMLLLGLTQPAVASEMQMNVATFNQKLNNKRRIYLDEYLKLCDVLKLHTAEEQKRLLGVALI